MGKKWMSLCLAAILALPAVGSVSAQAEQSSATDTPNASAQVSTQAYDWGRVKVGGGGFIPGIIFNPSEEGLVYVRTDMGGAYRWDEATSQWKQLLDWISYDEWNMAGVESLATDPVDPDRVYIAAGTYSNYFTDQTGVILRSTDRGETWESARLPIKFGGNMPGRSMGERLGIDPNNNSVLYFGARNGEGLWRSTDFGATWSKVESFNVPQDQTDYYGGEYGPVWVTFDPSTGKQADPATGAAAETTQAIYVGVADSTTSIYRSTDGGETWEAVAGQPGQGYIPHHGILAANGELYISYSKYGGPYDGIPWDGTGVGAVWKYNTLTGEWTDITPPTISPTDAASVPAYPFGGLAVDPSNPDTVMVSTMNLWWPDEHLFRSTDGGETWSSFWTISDGIRSNSYTIDYAQTPWLNWGETSSATDMEQNPKLGWMIGDLEIDPFNSDHFFYGTGATLYGSNDLTNLDQGLTVGLSVYAQGIEETAIHGLISPPEGEAQLFSSMADIGGFRHTDLDQAGEMITNPYLGNSTDLDFAQNNSNLIVRVGNASGTDARMGISSDNGVTWTPAANAWTASASDDTGGGWVAVGADGGSIVWAPSAASGSEERPVSYSSDLGATWTASAGIPQGAMVSSDRVNPDKFYGYSDGTFYVSTDGGATFTASEAAGLPLKVNSKFKAVSDREGDVWLVAAKDNTNTDSDYGIYHSTDSGASFTKLGNVEEAIMIGFGKAAPGTDYDAIYINGRIDGKFGFYRSDDAGESWVRINDDEHQYANATQAITGDPRIYGRVYIGTNGFGIVMGDIDGEIAAPEPEPAPTPTVEPSAAPTPTAEPSAIPAPTATHAVAVPGGGSNATASPTATPAATAAAEDAKAVLKLEAGTDGTAAGVVGQALLQQAAKAGDGKAATVTVTSGTAVTKLSVSLPAKALAELEAQGYQQLRLELNDAAVTLNIGGLGAAAEQELQLTLSFPSGAAAHPVYGFSLTAGGGQTAWTARAVKLAVPYALQPSEQPSRLYASQVDAVEGAAAVKGSLYDAAAQSLVFAPKQSGQYAVAYAADAGFSDVPAGFWASDAIASLTAQGIASGSGDGGFQPAEPVTRAQFVHLLVTALDLTAAGTAGSYPDVATDSWYSASAGTASSLGIVQGRPDGSFGASSAITRQDMAVMLLQALRASGTTLTAGSAAYSDSGEIAAYAKEAVSALSGAGLLSGQGGGSFAPQATATRAEAAVAIHNLLQYLLL